MDAKSPCSIELAWSCPFCFRTSSWYNYITLIILSILYFYTGTNFLWYMVYVSPCRKLAVQLYYIKNVCCMCFICNILWMFMHRCMGTAERHMVVVLTAFVCVSTESLSQLTIDAFNICACWKWSAKCGIYKLNAALRWNWCMDAVLVCQLQLTAFQLGSFYLYHKAGGLSVQLNIAWPTCQLYYILSPQFSLPNCEATLLAWV